ncbi:methylenetetrahydrofolate reductase-domain-containing protein [Hyaloraphidium curvatum]|nr:methylenetetrahydrofolate reductase-domain-containing protein [Hyaloraphidium curvatum]
MKIVKKIQKAEAEGRPYWSFEYFPPKTQQGVANLFDRFERMYNLGPEFIDVTWGAGGSTSDLTMDICTTALAVYGLETCMHLTCTNMPREKIDVALRDAKKAGIQNILALRGDPPRGQENWKAIDTGFANAVDLVRYIREQYGDYFCIGVAGYPEGHIDNPDKEDDHKHLIEKVKAGGDYVVTQFFYDVDMYLAWVKKCRDSGIDVPILPGLLPIQNYGGFKRMTTLCKTIVPPELEAALEPIKDDDEAVKTLGVKVTVDMCRKLLGAGLKGFHFYTLNLEKSVRLVLEQLNFVAPSDQVKPLPWAPSLKPKREGETVRPIFWANRMRTYILRTEGWDDYPNGRWGDARSPAYGDLAAFGHATGFAKTQEECLEMWGHPAELKDIYGLFSRYVSGDLPSLPWSDTQLKPESSVIQTNLTKLNSVGYLTINSQPAVDGAPSSDGRFGWGPKDGWVYQKAYLEFFLSKDRLDCLIGEMDKASLLTYYAVNKKGELRTNAVSESATALTWGVFPGRELIQPTILEKVSFLAWKDEAFHLWGKWADLYAEGTPSNKLLKTIEEEWWLCCVVDNNFKAPAGSTDVVSGGRFYECLSACN